jgi:hypothetical protein
MQQWITEAYLKVLLKCAIGKALGYSFQRWKELVVRDFDIENNPVKTASGQ